MGVKDKDTDLYQELTGRFPHNQCWRLLFTKDGQLLETRARVLPSLPEPPPYPHPLEPRYRDKLDALFAYKKGEEDAESDRWEEVFLPESASVWVVPDPDVWDVFASVGQAARFPRFVLAGARARYRLNPALVRVGIVVAGGSAPGLNQVVDSIVKRHAILASFTTLDGQPLETQDPSREPYATESSPGITILGFEGGYDGLLSDNVTNLTHSITDKHALEPGCFLKCLRTAKTHEVIVQLANAVRRHELDILYTIGGEGTQMAALLLARELGDDRQRPVIVAGPKTMDRDLSFADTTFGFQTTVDAATELILRMHDEAQTLNRLAIIELFGADSGFVALHASYASGEVDYVLIPEMMEARGTAHEVEACIQRLAQRVARRKHAVLVVAEGASVRWRNQQFEQGRTEVKAEAFAELADHIAAEVKKRCAQQPEGVPRGFAQFTNRPRHLIRSTPPNTYDIDLCKFTGKLLVDTALAGFTDCSVNLWHGQHVLVPLEVTTAELARVDVWSYYFLSMFEKYLLEA